MRNLRLERIELYHLRLPLVHPFETSFGRTKVQETLIVETRADGLSGFGECPASRDPFYSAETVLSAWQVISDHLGPRLLDAAILEGAEGTEDFDLSARFRQVRGNSMAKASLEMACADLLSQQRGVPLCLLYGGRPKRIPVGVSLGIEPDVKSLFRQIDSFVSQGYGRIKLKIRPGWDVPVIEKARRTYPELGLMVDANGAYKLEDLERLRVLDRFGLLMIEQPLPPDDLVDHATWQKALRTPICLDESIGSVHVLRSALALGSCRVVNIKQARLGGPSQAIAVHDLCQRAGIAVWCGGLLESGIGRRHNIALATLPNFRYPGDISASNRYYRQEVIDPPVMLLEGGFVEASALPGLGAAVSRRALKKFLVRHRRIR